MFVSSVKREIRDQKNTNLRSALNNNAVIARLQSSRGDPELLNFRWVSGLPRRPSAFSQ
jgi:hypothetical protein